MISGDTTEFLTVYEELVGELKEFTTFYTDDELGNHLLRQSLLSWLDRQAQRIEFLSSAGRNEYVDDRKVGREEIRAEIDDFKKLRVERIREDYMSLLEDDDGAPFPDEVQRVFRLRMSDAIAECTAAERAACLKLCEESEKHARDTYGVAESFGADIVARKIRERDAAATKTDADED